MPGNDVKPDADRISLEWGGLGQPDAAGASPACSFTNGQNQVIATAPSVALSFDPRSVFRGMLLPTSIIIERPTIEAEIDREGGMLRRIFARSELAVAGRGVDLLVEQLLAEPNYKSLLGQLDTVWIEQAKLTLRDVQDGHRLGRRRRRDGPAHARCGGRQSFRPTPASAAAASRSTSP